MYEMYLHVVISKFNGAFLGNQGKCETPAIRATWKHFQIYSQVARETPNATVNKDPQFIQN
jgi:hypothetical protein